MIKAKEVCITYCSVNSNNNQGITFYDTILLDNVLPARTTNNFVKGKITHEPSIWKLTPRSMCFDNENFILDKSARERCFWHVLV